MTRCHHVALAIVVLTLASCTPAVFAQQQADQQTAPSRQTASPPQTEPAQPSTTAPSQGCAEAKDTCELPPETAQPTTPTPQAGAETVPTKPATPESSQTTTKTVNKKTVKTKKVHKKKHSTSSGPRKIIVREGGTSDPKTQLSPATQEAAATRQSTDQLLASTQANLKTISARPLNANQQATVDQIKMFIEQANSALQVGDVQRGHNLAMKAHLLSDDLLRH